MRKANEVLDWFGFVGVTNESNPDPFMKKAILYYLNITGYREFSGDKRVTALHNQETGIFRNLEETVFKDLDMVGDFKPIEQSEK